jgi:hypothetical protein
MNSPSNGGSHFSRCTAVLDAGIPTSHSTIDNTPLLTQSGVYLSFFGGAFPLNRGARLHGPASTMRPTRNARATVVFPLQSRGKSMSTPSPLASPARHEEHDRFVRDNVNAYDSLRVWLAEKNAPQLVHELLDVLNERAKLAERIV